MAARATRPANDGDASSIPSDSDERTSDSAPRARPIGSARQLADESRQVFAQPARGSYGRALTRDEHDVPTLWDPAVGSEPFSHLPPDPISRDRIADLLGDREASATVGKCHTFCDRPKMTPVHLDTILLNGKELAAAAQAHRLGQAKGCHKRERLRLLLRDRDRDALTALGATAAKDLAATASLLAGAKSVGSFAALIMRLVGSLAHVRAPATADRDRYSTWSQVSRHWQRSPADAPSSRALFAPSTSVARSPTTSDGSRTLSTGKITMCSPERSEIQGFRNRSLFRLA